MSKSPRYKVVPRSESAHCCFSHTVIDTETAETIAEAFDVEMAARVCRALNGHFDETLAKENKGQKIDDEEFAKRIGLQFWIDREVVSCQNGAAREASKIEISLWDQLRHAYGFEARGTCNSKHLAQIDRVLDLPE